MQITLKNKYLDLDTKYFALKRISKLLFYWNASRYAGISCNFPLKIYTVISRDTFLMVEILIYIPYVILQFKVNNVYYFYHIGSVLQFFFDKVLFNVVEDLKKKEIGNRKNYNKYKVFHILKICFQYFNVLFSKNTYSCSANYTIEP